MNKYFIEELGMDCTFLEFRIVTFVECEKKTKKISQILGFLNRHHFLPVFKMFYYNYKAEDVYERQNVPSLTIDFKNDKFKFKYWDGAKTYWTYHTQDLFNILLQGRNDFEALIQKYKPVTTLLYDIKEEKNTIIKGMRYKYYPQNNVDILYELEFRKNQKDTQITDSILKEVYDKINELNLSDLKMEIDYSYEAECLPCQKAKESQNAN